MLDFAEQEIIIPTGRFAGMRFDADRQPFNRLWLAEMASDYWTAFWLTGPSQASKSLAGFLIPILYHLFEVGETVVIGLPDMELARDKWVVDLLPIIERTKYRDLLPTRGAGSRGGTSTHTITLRNSAVLKFMSGGGGDKSKAGFTSRILVISESDGFDTAGETSREADPITQMQARLAHFDQLGRVYGECTTSIEQGRVHQEIMHGSNSRLALRCPHCGAWVTLEREHVQGWQDARDEMDAEAKAHWCCSDCGKRWTEKQRLAANRRAVLVHKGQEVSGANGDIDGPLPRTRTLGVRFSAVTNVFASVGSVGAKLFRAQQSADPDNEEKRLCQFVFATPYVSPDVDMAPLDRAVVRRRQHAETVGVVPAEAVFLTCHIDLGKRFGHYMVIAWNEDFTGQIIDYSRFDIDSDRMGAGPAILTALRDLRDELMLGYIRAGTGQRVSPGQVWVDAGYQGGAGSTVVYQFIVESGAPFVAALGRGSNQLKGYTHPDQLNQKVRKIGDNYFIRRNTKIRVNVVHVNADYWKAFAHQRLNQSPGEPGALTLYHVLNDREHNTLAIHLTAERQVEIFRPGKGRKVVWQVDRRQNHHLDNLYNCCAAAHFVGARLTGDKQTPARTSWFAHQRKRL